MRIMELIMEAPADKAPTTSAPRTGWKVDRWQDVAMKWEIPKPPKPPYPPPPPNLPPPYPPHLPYTPATWSFERCLGEIHATVDLAGVSDNDRWWSLARNVGGGLASCCAMHPVTAPSRASGSSLQVSLLPLEQGKKTRNGGRVYLADYCGEHPQPEHYAAVPLVGRTLSVTVDLSAATCGCVAAFYLSYLRSAPAPGLCSGDWYCDANAICGTNCAEIDIFEANQHAFHAALHEATDTAGVIGGIGGSAAGLERDDFGPQSHATIVTSRPFRVHAFFEPIEGGEWFQGLIITLEQEGRSAQFAIAAPAPPAAPDITPPPPPPCKHKPSPETCQVEAMGQCGGHDNSQSPPGPWPCESTCCPPQHYCSLKNEWFSQCLKAEANTPFDEDAPADGRHPTATRHYSPLHEALRRGLTPVFSYWSSGDVKWLDGGKHGCVEDQAKCGQVVTFSDLAICEGGPRCAYRRRSSYAANAAAADEAAGDKATSDEAVANEAAADEAAPQHLGDLPCEASLPPKTPDFEPARDRADGSCPPAWEAAAAAWSSYGGAAEGSAAASSAAMEYVSTFTAVGAPDRSVRGAASSVAATPASTAGPSAIKGRDEPGTAQAQATTEAQAEVRLRHFHQAELQMETAIMQEEALMAHEPRSDAFTLQPGVVWLSALLVFILTSLCISVARRLRHDWISGGRHAHIPIDAHPPEDRPLGSDPGGILWSCDTHAALPTGEWHQVESWPQPNHQSTQPGDAIGAGGHYTTAAVSLSATGGQWVDVGGSYVWVNF